MMGIILLGDIVESSAIEVVNVIGLVVLVVVLDVDVAVATVVSTVINRTKRQFFGS